LDDNHIINGYSDHLLFLFQQNNVVHAAWFVLGYLEITLLLSTAINRICYLLVNCRSCSPLRHLIVVRGLSKKTNSQTLPCCDCCVCNCIHHWVCHCAYEWFMSLGIWKANCHHTCV